MPRPQINQDLTDIEVPDKIAGTVDQFDGADMDGAVDELEFDQNAESESDEVPRCVLPPSTPPDAFAPGPGTRR